MNNNGNYEPGNVMWRTKGEQSNNRRVNRLVVVGGRKMTAKQAATKHGLRYQSLGLKLRQGLTEFIQDGVEIKVAV